MSLLFKMARAYSSKVKTWLLDGSNQYSGTTGNWKLYSTGTSTASINSSGANFSNGGALEQAGMQTTNQIDLTGKTELHIIGTATSQYNSSSNPLQMGSGTTVMALNNCWQNIYVRLGTFASTGAFHIVVYISGISGSQYIGFGCVAVVTVSQIYIM